MTSGRTQGNVDFFSQEERPGGEGLGNDSMKPEESAQFHLDAHHVGVTPSGNVTIH